MTEEQQLQAAMAAIDAQRAILGDAVVEAALAPMREKLKALRAPQSVAEQRKQVSVLFADLSGFTAMAESMDPEELRDLIDHLWQRLDAVITGFGGHIDKHIGDAVMALWGSHSPREDDPEQAVRAALAMQEELARLRTTLAGASGIAMRVGINTGLVSLGAVGAKGEVTAMGDTVNLASRLEHACPVGSVLISHDTHRHVRGLFAVQALEPLKVKGKTEPVQTYRVERVRSRGEQARTRGIEGVETKMVGRGHDLARLHSAFAAAASSGLQGVILACEPGMGKSRLVAEFRAALQATHPRARLLLGQCSEHARSRPFFVLRELFGSAFGIPDGEPTERARERFETAFCASLGADPDRAMKSHFLGHLLGFDFAHSPHLRAVLGNSQQIRDRAFQYLCDFLAAICETTRADGEPLVVIIDDLHWADRGTLDALSHVFEVCGHLPLMVLCPTRSALFDERPNFGKPEWRHALAPLTKDETRALVAQILSKAEAVPEELSERIADGAEGIPFYVEELIKMLIDEKVIIKAEPHWRIELERLEEVRVPATLVGILQVRLDGLDPRQRSVLERGAACGRAFSDRMLASLHDEQQAALSLPEVRSCLSELVRRELLTQHDAPASDGACEYRFKHALMREVTYDAILRKHRRPLHAQVAAWLIARSKEGAPEHPGAIASHLELAGDLAHARAYYGRAGKEAQAACAPEAAAGFYEKALALLEREVQIDARERLSLFAGLGEVSWQQGLFAKAADAYARMGAIAAALGDLVAEARAANGAALAQQRRGDAARALHYAEQALELAERAHASEERARALVRKGMAHWALGDLKKTQALAEEAHALSTRLGDQRGIADSLRLLGIAHDIQGRPPEAASCFERARSIYQELGDHQMAAGMLNNLGTSAEIDGDYRRAVDYFERAFELARDMGFRVGATQFLSNLGGGRVRLGQFARAETDLLTAIQMVEARGTAVFLPETYGYLAEARLGLGQLDAAERAAHKSLELAQAAQHHEFAGVALRVLGSVTAAKQRAGVQAHPDSDSYFRQSVEQFAALGMDAARGRTLRSWAEALRRSGATDMAAQRYAEARAVFAQLGLARELSWTTASETGERIQTPIAPKAEHSTH